MKTLIIKVLDRGDGLINYVLILKFKSRFRNAEVVFAWC